MVVMTKSLHSYGFYVTSEPRYSSSSTVTGPTGGTFTLYDVSHTRYPEIRGGLRGVTTGVTILNNDVKYEVDRRIDL